MSKKNIGLQKGTNDFNNGAVVSRMEQWLEKILGFGTFQNPQLKTVSVWDKKGPFLYTKQFYLKTCAESAYFFVDFCLVF